MCLFNSYCNNVRKLTKYYNFFLSKWINYKAQTIKQYFGLRKILLKFRDNAYYWLKIYILKFYCLHITLIEGNNKILLV